MQLSAAATRCCGLRKPQLLLRPDLPKSLPRSHPRRLWSIRAAQNDSGRPNSKCAEQQGAPPTKQHQGGAARWLAGCAGAAASLLLPLLPAWASDASLGAVDGLDPALADSPEILDTLLIVVAAYFICMLCFIWLSSFIDEDAGGAAGSGPPEQRPPTNRGEVPPGYGEFLDAHVRSYVDPHGPRRQVAALQQLADATPLEGEDLPALKDRLAAGAAEALEQQLRDCERLVRTKLLARKLGYAPSRSSSSSGGSGNEQQQAAQVADNINKMLSAAVLSSPGGLSSHEHRAAIDALIEQHLDELLPPGGGQFSEDIIVRQVMRRLVGTLVAEEALLLLEGVDRGRRALEAAGRDKPANRWWALW